MVKKVIKSFVANTNCFQLSDKIFNVLPRREINRFNALIKVKADKSSANSKYTALVHKNVIKLIQFFLILLSCLVTVGSK